MNSLKLRLLAFLFVDCVITGNLSGFEWNFQKWFGWEWNNGEVYEKVLPTRSMSFNQGNNLFVETRNGSVKIDSWKKEEIKIDGIKKARAETEKKALEMIGNIEINILKDAGSVKIEAKEVNNSWVDFNIRVPEKAKPTIKSKNGSIRIQNLEGEIKAETKNGSIELSGIKGKVEIFSKNGQLALKDIKSEKIKAETKNGGIKILDAKGKLKIISKNGFLGLNNILSNEIEAKTKNGRIEFSVNTLLKPSDMTLETKNGSLSASVPEDPELSIYARTKNGELDSDFPIYTRKEQLKSEIKLKVETKNGCISIKKK